MKVFVHLMVEAIATLLDLHKDDHDHYKQIVVERSKITVVDGNGTIHMERLNKPPRYFSSSQSPPIDIEIGGDFSGNLPETKIRTSPEGFNLDIGILRACVNATASAIHSNHPNCSSK